MLHRGRKPGGGRRTLVGLGCALAALTLGGGIAAAQLPELPALPLPVQLPQPQDTVNEVLEPVQQLVHAPFPSPVEEIVQDSPVARVRETARGVVGSPERSLPSGNLPGGAEPSGSASTRSSPAPSSPPRQARPPSVGADSGGSEETRTRGLPRPGAGGGPEVERGGPGRRADRADHAVDRRTDDGASGSDAPRRSAGSGSTAAGAPDGTAPAEPTAAGREAPQPERNGGSIVRTVTSIVEVVPRAVWTALGLISLLALMFLARAVVERRRTRSLRRERERLLRDMSLLERVLLPRVPERMGDLAASVAYRPAAGPAAGGDFYDVFELSGGRVGLFVGDVSGHGREALDCTSALRPALRGHLEAGLSPRAALESAGRAAGIDPSGRFTTAVVAVHDPVSATLTYAAAGHPPPVVVGPGAHEPVIVASSPPIGVGLHTGKRQTTVPLPRGSSAAFVTDGLLEARSGDTLLGREWLESVMAAFGPLDSAQALLDRVFEAADVAADDMTACLVRAVDGPVTAAPRVEELELASDDVGAAAPGRFLEACGVPAEAVEDVLADARRLAVQAGKALLTVTIEGDDASVGVTAPTREALATT